MKWNKINKSSTGGRQFKKVNSVLKLGSLWKTIEEFGENTSFHGVKYMVSRDSSSFEKVLWFIIVASGVAGSVYMTLVFWERYSSNPIRTTIQSSYKPTSSIPFPGVTICSAVRVLPDKLRRLLDTAKIPNTLNKKKIQEAFPYLLGYTQPLQVNQSIVDTLEAFLTANELHSIDQLFAKVEPSCSDMFIKCKWMAQMVPCKDLFIQSISKDGICCSLNLSTEAKAKQNSHTFFYGYQMGLSVVIESVFGANEPSSIVSSLQSIGAKVLVHNAQDYPGMSSTEKILGNGTESFVRLLGTRLVCSEEVESLAIEQRNCLFSHEQTLQYFPQYKDSNCELECKMKKVLAACDCIPFTYPRNVQRMCNASDIPCLTTYYPSFYRNPPRLPIALSFTKKGSALRNMPKCTCLPQCNDVFYSVQTTGIPLRKVPYTASSFYEDVLADDNLSRSSKMIIHVFFGSHAQVVMLRDRITSTYYLLSSFGGVFSLFLGCSFISVLEIIYFFCIRIFVNCRKATEIPQINLKKY